MKSCKKCGYEHDKKRCPECNKAYSKAYYHSHKEQSKLRMAAWKKANPEHHARLNKMSVARNPVVKINRDKKYYSANREKIIKMNTAVYTPRRRARIKGAEGTYTIKEWETVCIKQGHLCARCHLLKPLTVDHIIPISRGGTNWISNIQGLCLSCNCSKGAKLEAEWDLATFNPESPAPSEQEARHHGDLLRQRIHLYKGNL